jgi:hypothetical protein
MRNTGKVANVNGEHFAICEHGGQLYLYDPQRLLKTPGRGDGLAGLGVSTNAAWSAATVGLNFVPVVGNILSAVSAIGQVLFGGGDSTPIETVAANVVTTRQKLAAARNARGMTDPFTVAAVDAQYGGDPSDPGGAAPMIAEEILGKPITQFDDARHTIKRADYYNAITAMNNAIAQIQATPKPAPAPVYTPPISAIPGVTPSAGDILAAPVTPANTGLNRYLPWILPALALAVYAAVS